MTGPRATKPLHRYLVVEYITAWSAWEVEATSKAEAIEKVKEGDVIDEGTSGDNGPNGRYTVERIDRW